MSAGHAHEELHHLVDRLSSDHARHADMSGEDDKPVRRRLSIAGIGASGEGNLSERVEDLPAERFNRTV
ncbi:hypothetical protein [Nonomuraea sp. NPDC049758]|uniref:hypothetical protein n=1 Tax=Nonomuraea sp. NPDC049758 TaxID=3154360 RepID=UPI00341E0D89